MIIILIMLINKMKLQMKKFILKINNKLDKIRILYLNNKMNNINNAFIN